MSSSSAAARNFPPRQPAPDSAAPLQPSAPAAPAPPAAPVGPRQTARPGSAATEPRSTERRTTAHLPLGVITAVLLAVNGAGMPYYLLDAAGRVRSPLHPWFRPSGYVGQTAGIAAAAIFVFLWLYPLRKKVRALAWTGSVGRWLDVHVTAALSLPLLLAIHAGWRFDGLIGLGFASMLVVCASGVVGRYLYVRIPRSRTGLELTRDEIAASRRELVAGIAAAVGEAPETVERLLHPPETAAERLGAGRALARMLGDDLRRWRAGRQLRRRWAGRGTLDRAAVSRALKLAKREMALTQQLRMLAATQQVFRYWHVAHRPFAFTALVAVIVHIAVVVALGATWFR